MEADSLKDKIKLIFSDVDTEGKKAGAVRAAEVYKNASQRMEELHRESEERLQAKKEDSYEAVQWLQELEERKAALEMELRNKKSGFASAYGLPEAMVDELLPSTQTGPNWTYGNAGGGQAYGSRAIPIQECVNFMPRKSRMSDFLLRVFLTPSGMVGIIELAYRLKKRKFNKAEMEGFEQAMRDFHEEFEKRKNNLARLLKERYEPERKQYIEATIQTLQEIENLEENILMLEIAMCI